MLMIDHYKKKEHQFNFVAEGDKDSDYFICFLATDRNSKVVQFDVDELKSKKSLVKDCKLSLIKSFILNIPYHLYDL